ncbi:hypothetical protein [Achromobacter denitrificans]|uniref:hypothetical protein n=1 Tax=Achromobacter denitrificans TaxID=32002 RepID=UPI003D027EA7
MILHHWDAYVGEPDAKHPLTDADKIAFARIIEAELSKLRAPVADERVPHHDQPQQTGVGEWCAPGPAAEQRRAWLLRFADTERGDCIYYDEQEARRSFAQAEGRGWNCYLFEFARRAPVAGEAVAHAVISYGRIQRLVVNEESAHEYAEQQRLNAEAAGWDAKAHVRPLVYGDAAPQASTVGGQAQAPKRSDTEILRLFDQELDEIFPPLPRLSGKGAHWDAAPQSSEAVRDARAEGFLAGLDQALEVLEHDDFATRLQSAQVIRTLKSQSSALSAQPELSSGAPNGRKRTAAERRAPMVERVYGAGVTAQPEQKEGGSDA